MGRKQRKTKSSIFPRYCSRKQRGGFLSRYDFAYAGLDSVNQAAHHVKKIAPELIDKSFDRARDLAPNLIRKTSRKLDAIAARRINQLTDDDPAGYSIPKCKTFGPFLGTHYSIAFKIVQTTTKLTV